MKGVIIRCVKISTLALLIFLSATPNARSQSTQTQEMLNNLHFSVDRPGISDYPTIVPKGNLQIETGFEYFQREDHRSMLLPQLMLRSAVSRKLEFRLTNRFIRVDSTSVKEHDKYYYNLTIDAKYLLFHEKGVLPATSILLGYSLTPATSKALRGPLWGNHLLLLMEDNLHDKVLFNYNLGIFWNGYSGQPAYMYSLSFEVELSTQHAIFIEQATYFNTGEKNDPWVVLGYTHLEAKHSQIDFSGGVDFNGGPSDYFFAVGYSTRIPYRHGPAAGN